MTIGNNGSGGLTYETAAGEDISVATGGNLVINTGICGGFRPNDHEERQRHADPRQQQHAERPVGSHGGPSRLWQQRRGRQQQFLSQRQRGFFRRRNAAGLSLAAEAEWRRNNYTFNGSNNLTLNNANALLTGGNPTLTIAQNTLTVAGAIGQDASGRGLTEAETARSSSARRHL